MVDSGVLEKIQKVRALAEHGTAGEMENAAAMLSRLLLKHNLSIESLDLAGDSLSGEVGFSTYEDGTNLMSWRAELMWQVAKHHFCQVIAYGKPDSGKSTWVIVGRPQNQEVVKEMYHWLEEEISRLGALELQRAKVQPTIDPYPVSFAEYMMMSRKNENAWQSFELAHEEPHKWTESWRLGAVAGIKDRFEEERRSAEKENKDKWAIVPMLDKEVDDFVKENFKTETVKKKRTADIAVYGKGREVGRGIGVKELVE